VKYVHAKQNIIYLNIVNKDFLESIRTYMFCCFCRAIANIWHKILALKSPAYSVVNTLWLSPARLKMQNNTQNMFTNKYIDVSKDEFTTYMRSNFTGKLQLVLYRPEQMQPFVLTCNMTLIKQK